MSKKFWVLSLFLISLLSCSAQNSKKIIVVTGNPVYAIVKELAGPKVDVVRLVPPGASPHTYQPKPSDLYKTQAANVLIYISENNDGWAVDLPGSRRIIRLLDFLPPEMYIGFDGNLISNDSLIKQNPNVIDPHFWTDPLAVKEILPRLADTLAALDPQNAATYRSNAALFAKRLDLIHRQIDEIVHHIKGKTVYLYHPSFLYFFKRYNIQYGGSIEEIPGKEPTPQFIANLTKKIKETGTKAVFYEPQLSDKTARIISESAGIGLYLLDPVGGDKGRENYSDMMLYNARTFKKALE